jgi:hypothetical protein
MSHRPNVTVQVVPLSVGAHMGLLGAFAIAEIDDVSRTGFMESPTEGVLVEAPKTVGALAVRFDTLRSEALPRGASSELIMRRAGDHEPH